MRARIFVFAVLAAGCNPSTIDLGPIDRPDAFVPRADAGGPRDAGEQDAHVAIDSGSDAGPLDAGPPDAGPRVCDSIGTCHPLYDASCRCGFSSFDAEWMCGRAGSGSVGAPCEGPEECGPALYCSQSSSVGGGMCRRLCDEEADCGPGQGCAAIDRISGCTGWCIALAECDLTLQDCGGGRGCYRYFDEVAEREHVFCHPAGARREGDLCFRNDTSCGAGLLCVPRYEGGTTYYCRRICTSDASCTAPARCTAIGTGTTRVCR